MMAAYSGRPQPAGSKVSGQLSRPGKSPESYVEREKHPALRTSLFAALYPEGDPVEGKMWSPLQQKSEFWI